MNAIAATAVMSRGASHPRMKTRMAAKRPSTAAPLSERAIAKTARQVSPIAAMPPARPPRRRKAATTGKSTMRVSIGRLKMKVLERTCSARRSDIPVWSSTSIIKAATVQEIARRRKAERVTRAGRLIANTNAKATESQNSPSARKDVTGNSLHATEMKVQPKNDKAAIPRGVTRCLRASPASSPRRPSLSVARIAKTAARPRKTGLERWATAIPMGRTASMQMAARQRARASSVFGRGGMIRRRDLDFWGAAAHG